MPPAAYIPSISGTLGDTGVYRHSYTKLVPFSREEEGNEQSSKQKEKERNLDINNKQTSIEIKLEL